MCINSDRGSFSRDLSFGENKSQWEQQIRYKADMPQGHIFFTKRAFRYAFYDQADINAIHEVKEKNYMDAYQQKIDGYAYEVQFAGAQLNPTIQALGKKLT